MNKQTNPGYMNNIFKIRNTDRLTRKKISAKS